MESYENVELLIKLFLDEVNSDARHDLTASKRVQLYKSFGASRLTLNISEEPEFSLHEKRSDHFLIDELQNLSYADKTLCLLAIMTVEKLLPKWDMAMDADESRAGNRNTPYLMLKITKELLEGQIAFEEADEMLNNDFWYLTDFAHTYDISCIYNAALFTMYLALYSGRILDSNSFMIDDETLKPSMDFASEAVKAYSAYDPNPPGKHNYDNRIPIYFNAEKRLEFWKWWLTQAIPHAWKLAHQSSNPQ